MPTRLEKRRKNKKLYYKQKLQPIATGVIQQPTCTIGKRKRTSKIAGHNHKKLRTTGDTNCDETISHSIHVQVPITTNHCALEGTAKDIHSKKRGYTRKKAEHVARVIKKKYTKADHNRKLQRYVGKLVHKLADRSKPRRLFFARRLVTSCLQIRGKAYSKFLAEFNKLRMEMEVILIKASQVEDTEEKHKALFGSSSHTSKTEPFYTDAAYNPLPPNTVIPINERGEAVLFQQIQDDKETTTSSTKKWKCSSMCKLQSNQQMSDHLTKLLKPIIECGTPGQMSTYINMMDDCNRRKLLNNDDKLGHHIACYSAPHTCQSSLLQMRIFGYHFPRIRYLVDVLYRIRRLHSQVMAIDEALQEGNLIFIRNVVKEGSSARETTCSKSQLQVSETKIYEQYQTSFIKLTKESADLPTHPCLSCERLCRRSQCNNTTHQSKPPLTQQWFRIVHYNQTRPEPLTFICYACLSSFKKNKLPPRCVLNNMAVETTPEEIATLNYYERILIQRAKAFQVVVRMGTVASKNMPHRQRVPKVTGQTFHLPLPINKTIETLPQPEDLLPSSDELYVVVRGLPNKQKLVWQDLVDVKKVYRALVCLKQINPLYNRVTLPLPHQASTLLNNRQLQQYDSTDVTEQPSHDLPDQGQPMLRHIDPEEETTIYQHLTIQALHGDRQNATSSALYQMLKVNEQPLTSYEESLDLMCFPDLYPYGKNGLNQPREHTLTHAEFVKTKLQSIHPQFRLNIQYLFHLLHQANMRQLRAGIYHKLNCRRSTAQLTVQQWMNMLSDDEVEGELSTIFGRLRNTEQYWSRPRNDVRCMTQHYGPATWFLTLSPGEWMWTDMGEYIRQVNNGLLQADSISELVARDPVSASRFMDIKFKAMLNFITSPQNPIGKVTHYFWRREYQGRGMQHFHLLIWIAASPVIGQSPPKDVADFLTKYVTCTIPDKALSPTLHERVLRFQQHKCNSYCLRLRKRGRIKRRVCRFGFPRPQRGCLKLRDVVESVVGRKALKKNSRLYDLPRTRNESHINDYNPTILLAWQGNMDLQLISEKSTVLNWYVTKYTTKPEKSNSVDIVNDINSNKSLSSKLWNIAIRSLSNRECGALEAADTLQGISLYGTDKETTIKWIDINMIRSRRIKPKAKLDVLQELDPESTDIFFPSWVDVYYPQRPSALESIHLYDFIRWYDIVKSKPTNSNVIWYQFRDYGFLRKRTIPHLINHYKYNPKQYPEKYFYSLLLMFKSWRDLSTLRPETCKTYTEAFNHMKDQLQEALQYSDHVQQIEQAISELHNCIQEELQKESRQDNEEEGPENALQGCAVAAMQEFRQVADHGNQINIDEHVSSLNEDQKRVFNHVTSTMLAQQQNQSNENTLTPTVLRHFVSGTGGTGKSFLIKTLAAWTAKVLNKDVAITAPTGIAAYNIDGLTIHRLLMLPVEHGNTPIYRELSDDALECARIEFRDVVLLIIDEVSMISDITLLFIHLRLAEIFDTSNSQQGWFGGINILLLGDLLQLPPVHEGPPFHQLSSEDVLKHTGAMTTFNLWNLFSYDELTINVRQQSDDIFSKLLSRVRIGAITANDCKILNERRVQFTCDSDSQMLQEVAHYITKDVPDTTCLLGTRLMCSQLNEAVLELIEGPKISLIAKHSLEGDPRLKQRMQDKLDSIKDSSLTAGLETHIETKIGAKVMLRRNIDVTNGLVNGAIGTLVQVKYAIDDPSYVIAITIAFQDNTQSEIERVQSKFELFAKAYVLRKQFPIVGAYAITIHKSQGLSLKTAVVDIGNSIFACGQAYVALSRVQQLSGLHILNFDPQSIKAQYNRLRLQFRPDLATIKTSRKKRPNKVNDRVWWSKNTGMYPLSAPLDLQQVHLPNSDYVKYFKGFANSDGVSCYANAVLQCLIQIRPVRSHLKDVEVFDHLLRLYEGHAQLTLNTLHIRNYVGHPYNLHQQQDAAEFLTSLATSIPQISQEVQFQCQNMKICHHCQTTSSTIEEYTILTLHVAAETKSTRIDDMLKRRTAWSPIQGSRCSTCNSSPIYERHLLVSASSVIVLQISLWSLSRGNIIKNSQLQIFGLTTFQLQVDQHRYKPAAIIRHHGNTPSSGHYTTLHSTKSSKWVQTNDDVISEVSWPRGGRDTYLVFLQRR